MLDSTASASAGRRVPKTAFLVALLAMFLAAATPPASASTESERLIDQSRITLEALLSDPNMRELQHYIKSAKGVLIFPQITKLGFVIGAEGGSGVLLVKGADGSWSPPAFFTLGAGSIGLQAGGQVSQVVFTMMNEGSVEAILDSRFKLGVDASVALGPIGKGVEASTSIDLGMDIYAFSKAVGVFGGGAFEGAAVIERGDWNEQFYGSPVPPADIVLHRKVFNPAADRLRDTLPN